MDLASCLHANTRDRLSQSVRLCNQEIVTAVIEQCGFPLPGDGLRRQKVSHSSKESFRGLSSSLSVITSTCRKTPGVSAASVTAAVTNTQISIAIERINPPFIRTKLIFAKSRFARQGLSCALKVLSNSLTFRLNFPRLLSSLNQTNIECLM